MAHKTNLMLIGVVVSVVLVACSSNATKTAETIPATATTMVLICDPPEHLDCAGANLSGANLEGANRLYATLPDGTIYNP